MNCLIFALLLPALGPATTAKPEVRGLLATDVTFSDDAGARLAAAVVDLLRSASYSRAATEEEWLAARRHCHIRVRFPEGARPVVPRDGEKVEVDEVIATFPLASTGGLWVRSGDRITYFAKYSASSVDLVQRLLREARPVE
jgi:hypothetical protein